MDGYGFLLVLLAGFTSGIAGAPVKMMKGSFVFEHWGLVSSVAGFAVSPLIVLWILCPDLGATLSSLPLRPLILGNLLSALWGVANVICWICLEKIGFCLTGAILSSVAIPLGIITPMILKGSGTFSDAPDPLSPSGIVVLLGAAITVYAVVLSAKAGFGKEGPRKKSKGFALWLALCVLAGFLSLGISFSFVYTQGAIAPALAASGIPEKSHPVAIRILTLAGGAAANIIFPVFLLARNRSWGSFLSREAPRNIFLSLPVGCSLLLAFALAGEGMVALGPLGASVGFGVIQAMQIIGSQTVGFIAGEWRGVERRHTRMMVKAIIVLLVAILVISVGQAL